jgi:hypothetical protein
VLGATPREFESRITEAGLNPRPVAVRTAYVLPFARQ